MKFSGPLKPGATIMLIAPSSPLRGEYSWQDCADGLRALGYNIAAGRSLEGSTRKGYAAAPAEMRAADINSGFADDSIDAIWAVRGGSMAMELLDMLDADCIAKHPKPLIGFIDITALHIFLQEKCGISSYHAPCASSFARGMDEYAFNALNRVLSMEKECEHKNPEGEPIHVLHEGCAEGELVGGNLTLVASLTGTRYALSARGRILFLEDVEEDVYRLNRMLLQLKLSGILDEAEGILFGAFTDCPNGYNAEYGPNELLQEFFADYKKPIYAGLSVGHIRKNAALPLGVSCRMENGSVRFRV